MDELVSIFMVTSIFGFFVGSIVHRFVINSQVRQSDSYPRYVETQDPDYEYVDVHPLLKEIDEYIQKTTRATNEYTPVSIKSLQTFRYYIQRHQQIQVAGLKLVYNWHHDAKLQPPMSFWFRLRSHFYDGYRHRAKMDAEQLRRILITDQTQEQVNEGFSIDDE